MTRSTTCPFLKSISVGIDMIPYFSATDGTSSTFSFTTVTLAPHFSARDSTIGATWRHGPHHTAQKSTRTGLSLFRTDDSKVASVISVTFADILSALLGARLSAPALKRLQRFSLSPSLLMVGCAS